MRKGLEFSFNPEFISAELAESLAQAMSQWIAQREEGTGTAQEQTQNPDALPEGQMTR